MSATRIFDDSSVTGVELGIREFFGYVAILIGLSIKKSLLEGEGMSSPVAACNDQRL